jgi:hypothetical protein
MRDFQELAYEAFADLLHKHRRRVDLKTAFAAECRRRRKERASRRSRV